MPAFDAKADTAVTSFGTGDKLVFGDVSADGWDTITVDKALAALSAVADTTPVFLGATVRQSGGVAGTDEIQITHDGTDGTIENKDTGGAIYSKALRTIVRKSSGAPTGATVLEVQNTAGTILFQVSDTAVMSSFGAFLNSGSNWAMDYAGSLMFVGRSTCTIGWASGAASGSPDTGFKRAAAKVVQVTDGSTGTGWLQNTAGRSRVTSDVTNTGTTLAAITGLSATVIAGRKYAGRLVLFCDNSVAAEGVKIDFSGGTATWTSFRAAVVANVQGATLGTTVSAAVSTVLNATALNGTGVNCLVVEFAGVCNAAGTFIPQAAKNSTGGGGTLTVRTDSNMPIEDYP